MPFRSKKQWGWAFATGQPFARRWARATPGGKGTRYRNLPASKNAGAVAGASLGGPGGLMATPGLGARPGRKWGKRRKEHYPDQSQFAGHTMEDWDDTLPDSFYKAEPQPTRVLGLGHTSVMVALYPDADAAARIAQAAGVTEPIEGLHLTLCYLGDSSDTPLATNKARLIGAVQQWARAHGRVLRGELNGLGRFFHTEDDGTNAVWIAPDMPGLPELRQSLADWIERSGFDYAQNHGFTPHITVAYVPEGAPTPPIRVDGPIAFDHATLAWGDAQYDLPFIDATTKAKRITGNLFRADDGKFQAGGASGPAPKPADPRGARTQPSSPARDLADAAGATADRARAGGAADLRGGMADLVGQARGKRPKKASGGGGGKGKKAPKPKATPAERRAAQAQQRAQAADATAAQLGLATADVAALRQAAEAGGAKSAALSKLGLIDAAGDATDAGRRALSALERGDVRGYRAAVQDATERQGRAQARASRQAAQTQRQVQRAQERATRQRETDRRRAAQERRQARRDRIAGARAESAAQKSFTVYKASDGTPRWLARTTTAYRDRDGEILSVAALDADSQRMTATKQFGPLRWWHVGRPDPANAAAPWGPGLDLGDCDFSVVIGRTRIESGTFKSAAIARAVARVADHLDLSPGFFHPPNAPDADGVFGAMHTFERSTVPTRYAQASNLFTGLTVKESSMDNAEIARRFKAAVSELGLTREQALALSAQLVETEKTAQAQGIAYKSADAPAVYTGPDGTPGIIQDGRFVALKAAAPAAAAAAEDAPVVEKAPDMGADLEEAGAEMEDAGEYLGDMEVSGFQAMLTAGLTQALAPLIKAIDVTGKMAGQMEELKSMLGGYATKEAGTTAEVVAVKEQIAALTTRLATLESDAPGEVLGAAALAALKSSGPTVPPTPDGTPQIDPHNPLAQLTAGLFPELYGGNRQ